MKIFAVMALLAATAWARPAGTPSDAIRAANTKVRELLSQKATAGSESERRIAAKVTTELRDLFDIRDLARRALVDHWEQMSPGQRESLVETLRLIVERNYVTQLRNNLAYDIEYKGEEPQGQDVLVHTVIKAQRGGRPIEIPVEYLLHAEADHWKAYDVITDEVSILKNYRSQFNRIINKDGVDGLIKRMKTKLEAGEE